MDNPRPVPRSGSFVVRKGSNMWPVRLDSSQPVSATLQYDEVTGLQKSVSEGVRLAKLDVCRFNRKVVRARHRIPCIDHQVHQNLVLQFVLYRFSPVSNFGSQLRRSNRLSSPIGLRNIVCRCPKRPNSSREPQAQIRDLFSPLKGEQLSSEG